MEDELDLHCLAIIQDFLDGHTTHQECEAELQKHGDRLLADLLANGFKVRAKVDTDSWRGVIGSNGE